MKEQKIPLRKGWKITAIIFTVLYTIILLMLLIVWEPVVFVFFTIVFGIPAFICWMLATKDRRAGVNKKPNISPKPHQEKPNNKSKSMKEKEPNVSVTQENVTYSFEELRLGALKKIPKSRGIYKVYMPNNFEIKFRADSDAPYTKNQLKDVSVLQKKWTEICKYPGYEDGLLYIGKSTELRRRIREYVRTGYGEAITHYGGSAIFQLENNKQLQIKIFECENCEEREAEEIDAYIQHRKVMPLANWSKGTKKTNKDK